MRALLFILIVVVLVVIVALVTGFLDINQIRGAKAPQVSGTGNGVTAQGGEAPAFDVQTGSVKIGSSQTTVQVPKVVVEKPGQNETQASTNNTM
jgi:hypothetical protein